MRTPGHPAQLPERLPFYLVLFAALIVVNTLAAKFAVISFGIAPGVSSLYVAVTLMIVFALWFGMWGAIAAYVACFIGAGMAGGIPPGINIFWSLADFWQVLIPLLAFRLMGADESLTRGKDLLLLLVFGIVLNNIAGATFGSVVLAAGGIITINETIPVLYSWFIGNAIACLILVPVLLHGITPVLGAHNLLVRRYWQ